MNSDERTNRDWQYIIAMARQLSSLNEKMFTAALDKGDSRLRAAALLSAVKYKEKYVPELIDRVGDDDVFVCQCSRHSLAVISNMYLGGKQYVDFGPLPNDHAAAKNAASLMWKVWFDDMKDKKPIQKPAQGKASTTAPKTQPQTQKAQPKK